jgi:hypothetical protein
MPQALQITRTRTQSAHSNSAQTRATPKDKDKESKKVTAALTLALFTVEPAPARGSTAQRPEHVECGFQSRGENMVYVVWAMEMEPGSRARPSAFALSTPPEQLIR